LKKKFDQFQGEGLYLKH